MKERCGSCDRRVPVAPGKVHTPCAHTCMVSSEGYPCPDTPRYRGVDRERVLDDDRVWSDEFRVHPRTGAEGVRW